MKIPLDSIISLLEDYKIKFKVSGDNLCINKLAAIGTKINNALCYYVGDNPDSLYDITESVIFCTSGLNLDPFANNAIIFTDNPQRCFYLASSLFKREFDRTISKKAVIDQEVITGVNTSIGPFCHIEKCKIGDDVIIDSGVKIYQDSILGNNIHIQSNTVIGATGVMWVWDSDGQKVACEQTGRVVVEDDVFIGSNVTIVKGPFFNRNTIIGKGTMIAHGTMIGHGSQIGPNNHFANNVSVAGSVMTGKNCFFGSGATIRPHIKLADDTVVGAGAVVVNDFIESPGLTIAGNPAKILKRKTSKLSGVPENHHKSKTS
jgi:UDP-3-O-[3-hydroxymyristoyl] glucosamine N-acyltransferase